MNMGIYIVENGIWGKSRPLLLKALGSFYNRDEYTLVLNFGCNIWFDDDICVLNKNTEVIYNKIRMNMMLDSLEIPHPKTYYFPFDNLPDTEEECVIKKANSYKGKGVRFSKFNNIDIEEIDETYYIQHYIPFEREYRVGVDFRRVLGIREKIPIDASKITKIKNSLSCTYETVQNKRLSDFAFEILKKFKLDFCGIDIGEYCGNYIVIELNSAPTIGEYWAKLLAQDLINKYYEVNK